MKIFKTLIFIATIGSAFILAGCDNSQKSSGSVVHSSAPNDSSITLSEPPVSPANWQFNCQFSPASYSDTATIGTDSNSALLKNSCDNDPGVQSGHEGLIYGVTNETFNKYYFEVQYGGTGTQAQKINVNPGDLPSGVTFNCSIGKGNNLTAYSPPGASGNYCQQN